MFYKKVDLEIPLHLYLVFHELNKYTFFYKKPLLKKLNTKGTFWTKIAMPISK